MTCHSLHFLVPGIGPAGLPLPPTTQSLLETEQPVHRPDAAEPEYPPRTPDPGAVEFASWAAYLQHSVR